MKGFVRAPVLILTFCLAAGAPSAHAFDCAKAYLPVDFVICSDPAVIRANDTHERAWYDARARLTDAEKQELLTDQRRWLKEYPARCGVPAQGKPLPTISRDQQLSVARALDDRRAFLEQYDTPPPQGARFSTETTASPTAAYPQVAGRFSRIEEVDFFNFTYPVGPNDCPNDFGPRKTITLKGGNYTERFKDSTLSFGMNKSDVAYGDITGSSTHEAVIALSCSFMANFSTTTIYVYTLRDGVPTPLTKIPWENINKNYRQFWGNDSGPVWGVTELKAGKGRFTFEGSVDSPHACPATIARFVYAWNGNGFVLAGKPAKRKNPQC